MGRDRSTWVPHHTGMVENRKIRRASELLAEDGEPWVREMPPIARRHLVASMFLTLMGALLERGDHGLTGELDDDDLASLGRWPGAGAALRRSLAGAGLLDDPETPSERIHEFGMYCREILRKRSNYKPFNPSTLEDSAGPAPPRGRRESAGPARLTRGNYVSEAPRGSERRDGGVRAPASARARARSCAREAGHDGGADDSIPGVAPEHEHPCETAPSLVGDSSSPFALAWARAVSEGGRWAVTSANVTPDGVRSLAAESGRRGWEPSDLQGAVTKWLADRKSDRAPRVRYFLEDCPGLDAAEPPGNGTYDPFADPAMERHIGDDDVVWTRVPGTETWAGRDDETGREWLRQPDGTVEERQHAGE